DKFSKISRTEIDNNFAGGSGGGATLTPIAFLVVGKNGVEIINTTQISNIEKVVDIAKDIVKGIVKN
ncbi:MAG: GerW family sporulation protein, partial [Clostridia bacterium]